MEKPQTETEEQTEEVLPWQIKRLEEKIKAQERYWEELSLSRLQEIHRLESENKALKEELEGIKDEQNNLQALLQRESKSSKKRLEEAEIRANRLEEESASMKIDMEAVSNKRLELELELQLTLTLVRTREDKTLVVNELKERHQREVDEIKKPFTEEVRKLKGSVNYLKSVLREKEQFIEEEESKKEDARFQNVLRCKALQIKVDKLKDEITALKRKQDLTKKVADLQKTIQNQKLVIVNKDMEIAALKKGKREMQEYWCREQDANAILLVKLNDLKDNIKCLEEEKKDEQTKLKDTTDKLSMADRINADLTDRITCLRYKVKASEPDLIQLRAKVHQLETYQLRFKADLQSCMAFITEPKELKRRIITLKGRYIDNEKVGMDDNSEAAYRHEIACLKTMINASEKIQKHQRSEKKNMETRLDHIIKELGHTRAYYVKRLNETVREVDKLKKEVKEKDLLLKKATKPVQQKIRSWITKKVLRVGRAAPEVAETPDDDGTSSVPPCTYDVTSSSRQPPGRRDDDVTSSVPPCTYDVTSSSQQPPRCPDDDFMSSMPPCTDDVTPSSQQPRAGLDNVLSVNLRPYVDDGLPSVDT